MITEEEFRFYIFFNFNFSIDILDRNSRWNKQIKDDMWERSIYIEIPMTTIKHYSDIELNKLPLSICQYWLITHSIWYAVMRRVILYCSIDMPCLKCVHMKVWHSTCSGKISRFITKKTFLQDFLENLEMFSWYFL